MIDVGQQFAVEAAVVVRLQMEEAAFHPGHPTAIAVTGDAGEHLRGFPGIDMTAVGAPALQSTGRNIHPVQGVFLGDPDWAFSYRVTGINNQFGLHGNSFPWIFVVGIK